MRELNIEELDVFDDIVDLLSTEQEDALLEREMAWSKLQRIPRVPCECFFCHNWIDNTELFRIVGYQHDKIVCLSCGSHESD